MKYQRKRITKETKQAVLEHYKEHRSTVKASDLFKVSQASAWRIIKQAGLLLDGSRGENSNMWKGGKKHTAKGYIMLRDPLNVMCDKNGYVWEHRVVMARHLKRPLLKTEVVHHIDGNKRNNEISNLMLFSSQAEHIAHHKALEKQNR